MKEASDVKIEMGDAGKPPSGARISRGRSAPKFYFIQILKTDKARYHWSDSEELHVIANLYQVKIKVIKTEGDNYLRRFLFIKTMSNTPMSTKTAKKI